MLYVDSAKGVATHGLTPRLHCTARPHAPTLWAAKHAIPAHSAAEVTAHHRSWPSSCCSPGRSVTAAADPADDETKGDENSEGNQDCH